MPKQFHALVSDRTMIQETFDRLVPVFGADNIYVATNAAYAEIVKQELPDVSAERIIAEPVARDTASGMALVCAVVAKRHPEAIVASFHADHVISNPQTLQGAIAPTVEYLSDSTHADCIVTFGIRPRYPETGFGYIKRGAVSAHYGAYTIFDVERFVEKPDLATAKEYIADGSYEWNAGMFVFRVAAMIAKFARYAPETHAHMERIRAAVDTEAYDTVLAEAFPQMEKVSIDYAILEKDDRVAVLPLTLSWSDIGSWAALRDMLASHTRENVVRGDLIAHNSEGLFVRARKPVVAIGVEDLVIVDEKDVLLVCDRDHAQDVSAVVKRLAAEGYDNLL